MANIPTPHITAAAGDFARTVLMPGDPLRAKFIADTYFTDAKLVNNVRGVQGYTGFYKGKRVSVMASGMGMPSIGIYSYELYNFYGVENIIRVGSAGMIDQKLHLRDIVAGMSCYTNSSFGQQFGFEGHLAPCCSFELLSAAADAAKKLNAPFVPGALYLLRYLLRREQSRRGSWNRWACWPWKWKLRRSISTRRARAKTRWRCAPFPTIPQPAKGSLRWSVRRASRQMMEIALEIA